MTTEETFPTRKATSTLVGWCRYCECYDEPWSVGMQCPNSENHYWREPTGMQKRRMWICSECFEGHFTYRAFEARACFSI